MSLNSVGEKFWRSQGIRPEQLAKAMAMEEKFETTGRDLDKLKLKLKQKISPAEREKHLEAIKK